MRKFKLVIVGAGPQGIMLARHAKKRLGMNSSNLALIDPYEPGKWWMERLHDCATDHLRSGPHDHVDCERNSLLDFAAAHGRKNGFATADRRPCVLLFNDHLQSIVEKIRSVHLPTAVIGLRHKGRKGYTVLTEQGDVEAERLVLAIGPGEPNYPEWAHAHLESGSVRHIFDKSFERSELKPGTRVALAGGGISAIQVALALAKEKHVVDIYTRRALGARAASDPQEWTPSGLLAKLRAMQYEERYTMLADHGDKGTLPGWEMERMQTALTAKSIRHRVCQISKCNPIDGCLKLETESDPIDCDLVVLGTGFRRILPEWLKLFAAEMGLPLTSRGEPQLTDQLEWGQDTCLHVMGGHASPVLGPYADNLIGARMAVEILSDLVTAPCGA